MKTVDQLPKQMQLAYDAINSLVSALQSNIDTAKNALDRFPQGHNLQVVIVNPVYVLGLESNSDALKLYSHIDPRGYDIDLARRLKKSWKGKDGSGRPIEQSELVIKNGRRFLKDQIQEMTNRHSEYSDKLKQMLSE